MSTIVNIKDGWVINEHIPTIQVPSFEFHDMQVTIASGAPIILTMETAKPHGVRKGNETEITVKFSGEDVTFLAKSTGKNTFDLERLNK